jgi:hypothetical protein
MNSTPPVDFKALAQTAANPASGGYPYQIRASDLDKNFVFATADYADEFEVSQQNSAGGHAQRVVKLKPGTSPDQYLKWDGEKWIPSNAQKILRP